MENCEVIGFPTRTFAIRKSRQLIVVALLMALTVDSLALVHATDPVQPSLTALHYFVGDPLFGLEGTNGNLFSNLPDEPTAMASTTKIATLHIAVDALMGRIPGACGGVCHLGDEVKIGSNAVVGSTWVPQGSSLMGDAQGEPLLYDNNMNQVFDLGDIVLRGLTPTSGTPLSDDPRVMYVDSNNDNFFDSGETLVLDANGNSTYDKNESSFFGAQPSVGTALNDDPRMLYADTSYDPGSWDFSVSLQVGEKVGFDNLLRGLMYPSGNDAAIAIAEYVAGNVETFVEKMNELTLPGHITAEGLPNTHFTNPAGLDDFCPTFSGLDPLDPLHTGNPEFCQLQYFKNVVNIGGTRHYTTARDLARIWLHGMQDPLFSQVVGFQGTYTFCTSFQGSPGDNPACTGLGLIGDKFYQLGYGFGYPGWEGGKGGSTAGCGSPATNCAIFSANRLGRELVADWFQGACTNTSCDTKLMLDYGFAKLFHPDERAMKPDGFFGDDAIAVLPNGRVVTAGITSGLATKVTTWSVDVDNSQISELGEASVGPPSASTSIPQLASIQAVALSNGYVVVAKTVSSPLLTLSGGSPHPSGSITLSLWSISDVGIPILIAQNVPVGQGFNARLLKVSSSMFVTSYVGSLGRLVLKSWQVQGTQPKPKLTMVNQFTVISTVPVDEGVATGFGSVGGFLYFATPERKALDGKVVSEIWRVNSATGEIQTQVGWFVNFQDVGDHLSASPVPVEALAPDELFIPFYFAVGFRTSAGTLQVAFARVSFDFNGLSSVGVAGDTEDTGEAIIGGPSLEPFGGSGLMIDMVDANSNQKLIVWEVQRYADDTVDSALARLQYKVSENVETGTTVKDAIILGLPTTHSEGDFVSATLDAGASGGVFRLWAWRVGDRPL